MIDFRYHLVSLVSVFLALAVGIVLGAGPLEGSIGQTLNDQVEALRADRDSLREEVDQADAALAHRSEFITAVTPALVADQLGGRSVVLVTLPGLGTDDLDDLSVALEDAGAAVTGRVAVTETWGDPAEDGAREEVLQELLATLGPDTTGGSAGVSSLDALLARAVLVDDLASAGPLDDEAVTILETLERGDLIAVQGELAGRATEAVVIAPPVEVRTDQPPQTPAQDGEPAVVAWAELSRALDVGSDGVVVLGPASSASAGGLVAAVRADESLSAAVSTVDTAGTSMGAVTTVLALTEQLRGGSGAYGFGEGAQAPLPDLPAAQDPIGVLPPTVAPTTQATLTPSPTP